MLEQLVEHSRRLRLEGVHNLRDVGGYPTRFGRATRWGVLYRSDSLHRLTAEAQQALLGGHGLRTVIDLRRAPELERSPNVFAGSEAVRYRHLPLIVEQLGGGEAAQSLEEMFRRLLEHHQAQIAGVLRELLEPGAAPALVHCTAGKDRTGAIVALALGAAGVPHDDIVADFARSAEYLAPIMDDLRQHTARGGMPGAPNREWVLASRAETMWETLTHLDSVYGSVTGYLRAVGLSDAELHGLRTLLAE